MKKMYKSRNEENLLPFHIIKAASEGDVSAINTVLKHYEGYRVSGIKHFGQEDIMWKQSVISQTRQYRSI